MAIYGSRPDREITPAIETTWLEEVLKRTNEKRCAICIESDDRYVGNVQLTHIESSEAEFHIFIGDTDYWGKGICKLATREMVEIGFDHLNLDSIYLNVRLDNIAAFKAYESVGFVEESVADDFLKMRLAKTRFRR